MGNLPAWFLLIRFVNLVLFGFGSLDHHRLKFRNWIGIWNPVQRPIEGNWCLTNSPQPEEHPHIGIQNEQLCFLWKPKGLQCTHPTGSQGLSFFVSMLVISCDGILPKKPKTLAVQDEHLWKFLTIQGHRHAFGGTWGLERMKGCLSPNRGWSMSVGKDREGAADVVGFLGGSKNRS